MEKGFLDYCIPQDMKDYLSYWGYHFNKNLVDFATSMMYREDKTTGEPKQITPIKIDELKSLLKKHNVEIENKNMYDALYLANMVKADFLGSSIEDEEHMAKYIENVLCDEDGYEGMVFNRFVSDCAGKGEPIYWDMMI